VSREERDDVLAILSVGDVLDHAQEGQVGLVHAP
jgi:hypothetical protein